jgi:uncharacterized protein (DUF952 family)
MMIYHIVLPDYWAEWKEEENYYPATFEQEGFIHLSTAQQVPGVLERYYQGVKTLILLEIATEKLKTAAIYEPATSGENYPHIYGPINREAIVKIHCLNLDHDDLSQILAQ